MSYRLKDLREHFVVVITLSLFTYFVALPDEGFCQFTAVSYGFQNVPAAVPIHDPTGDLPIDLTCLAANGYGQWMYGTDNASPAALLVGDSLSKISTSSAPRPNGVIGLADFGGDDVYQYTVKVAANLLGSVRYVWPATGGTGFVIRGLNDNRGSQGTQINIALDGNLNSLASRKIITGSAFHVSNASNDVSNFQYYMGGWTPATENEYLVQSTYEDDERDQWDIAIDAKYLYIVWEHYDGNYGGFEIFANAIQLSDGSTAPNFPIHLHDRTNSGSPAGRGRRPTISCDVRNSPSKPCFDIAYLLETTHASGFPDPSIPYNSSVRYCAVRDGSIFFDHSLPTSLYVPGSVSPYTYSKPLHARIVTSSTFQTMEYAVKDIYVIAGILTDPLNGNTNSNLLLAHRIESDVEVPPANTTVHYVDGALLTSHAEPLLSGAFPVVDDPLRAFTNPYDGQSAVAFDEFHALYRMLRTSHSTPLLIVRGFNNGFAGTTDSRTPINRAKPDPSQPWIWMPDPVDLYLGAANQAGIHVHWGDQSAVHYYSRDIRAFDEAIEENTLLSYEGRVADGTYHGGTVGAIVKPGRLFTIWTDLLFNNGALFVAPVTLPPNWSNGRLIFTSNNSVLQIGSGVNTDPSSTLTILPNFECWLIGTGQELSIKPNSTCNYYGIPAGKLGQNFVGPGIVRFSGDGITTTGTLPGHSFPAIIANAANLYIRGGATLRLPDEAQMLADKAYIELKFEPALLPLSDPTTSNPPTSGQVNASGHVSLANSILLSHLPSAEDDFKVTLCTSSSCTALPYQFESSECLFKNTDPLGSLHLFFTETSLPARIIGGLLYGASVKGSWIHEYDHAIDIKPLEIGFARFNNIHSYGVWLNADYNSHSSLHYHGIYIHGNDFGTYTTPAADGVLVQRFYVYMGNVANAETSVEVSNNTFDTPVGLGGIADTNHVTSAIHFITTSGGILSNSITGQGYANGIIAQDDGSQEFMSTLACNNHIAGCKYSSLTGSGISSSWWVGYSKMNRVSNCNRGFFSGDYDGVGVIFSNYSTCIGAGIFLASHYSSPNLRGVHHAVASTDYPAYDTLSHNNKGSLDPAEFSLVSSYANIGGTSPDLDLGNNNFVDNGLGELLISASGSGNSSALDNNYWQHNGSAYFPALTLDPLFHNINEHRNAADPNHTSYYLCPFSISCSGGFISPVAEKGAQVRVLASDTAECYRLERKTLAYLTDNYPQLAYDTGRYYMVHCSALDGVPREFASISLANQNRDTNSFRYLEYRDWLKSVLYLNKDTEWYCSDANAIIQTFQYIQGSGVDFNGELAVIQYLLKRGACPNSTDFLQKQYGRVRDLQRQRWVDTVRVDTNLYKLDTTLPSLKKLGLEILMGPIEHRTSAPIYPAVARLRSTRNPFSTETEISFALGDRELIQLRVFDVLGKKVFDNGIGSVLESGDHSVTLNARDWAAGTYYLRLSTPQGVVQTLKLQHLR